ncbi:MAG: B12-binding domain-containing radical SAM protein [Lentisphaerae bacterium]|jgi:radical SAM superfamily enzyme YgiQ (UPF0313 family)|nr:B12-binding domain-containing radical SAM protein [Lentisphaerota bacterium]MBT5604412.1 B12-binding domain-containing radical SAM protein [Lentisphaerota bacterium]MBT7058169.1 B12-binding domain-containing radical SAM protein [Lentisphaerota bacterium]MBT7847447.1 B12-binding domain-containing radical SAM protein [Lentisphaerota bacterium]
MRLVWLAVNASYSHSSLALPLLHSAARDVPGVEWHAVRGTAKEPPIELADRVAALAPDVVAASVFLFTRRAVLDTVARVKALRPETTVILGGPEFLGENQDFLQRNPGIGAVMRGEGEQSFARWLEAHSVASQWPDIPGLCWIDARGNYRDNGLAEAVLDSLPLPEESPFFDWGGPFVQLETSRGCPNRCSFCTSCRSRPRAFSWNRVVAELELVRRHEVSEVRILDRTFNSPPERAIKLLRLFRDEYPDISFHLEIHPAAFTEALCAELEAARPEQLHLEIGLQSGTPSVLRALGRCDNVGRAWDSVGFLCRKTQVRTHVDLIAGLPKQTFDNLRADLARLAQLGPTEIQLEVLKLLPGTPLHSQAPSLGLVASPMPPYDVLATPSMPRQDLTDIRRLSRFIDQFYNQPQLHEAIRTALVRNPSFLCDELPTYSDSELATTPSSLRNRFRYLHQRLAKQEYDGAREKLELAWILHGFSPERGLSEASCWTGLPPIDAGLIAGTPPNHTAAKHRVWRLEQTNQEYWFVYRGRGAAHKPLAVYTRERHGSGSGKAGSARE